MAISTSELFGLQVLKEVRSANYVDWAVGMIVEGYDSPSLRILAGLDENGNVFETEETFGRVVRELGMREPNTSGKLGGYACYVASRILSGMISPENGVKALYRVWRMSDYKEEYFDWVLLDDALDWVRQGDFDMAPIILGGGVTCHADWVEKVKQAARKLVDGTQESGLWN